MYIQFPVFPQFWVADNNQLQAMRESTIRMVFR